MKNYGRRGNLLKLLGLCLLAPLAACGKTKFPVKGKVCVECLVKRAEFRSAFINKENQ